MFVGEVDLGPTCDADIALRHSEPQKPRVALRTLHKVMSPGYDEEPLGVVIDHEVDDVLEPGGNCCEPDERVRRDDRLISVQAIKKRGNNLQAQSASQNQSN